MQGPRRHRHNVGAGGPPGGLILLYHRVALTQTDPQLLAVSPAHFSEHLEVLRRTAVPMHLREMVRRLAEGTLPARAVAVTFDDGYLDNLLFARSLLAGWSIPATVFVTTGYLDGRREFWWDALERIFLRPGRLPERLRLSVDGRERQWELNGSSFYGPEDYCRETSWNVLLPERAGPRQRLYAELCDLLRPLTEHARERILDELSAWSGISRKPRAAARPMTASEVAELAQGGLVEVGAHTATHPVLAVMPEDRQREEMSAAKACVEAILGRPAGAFSYPYGTRRDYTAGSVRLARESGFEAACSNFRGVVRADVDPLQLPRVIVRDWDGDEFARRIEEEWLRT